MVFEEIPRGTFEIPKERAITSSIKRTLENETYKSYRLLKRDGKEIILVKEYLSETDIFPYDSVEYLSK